MEEIHKERRKAQPSYHSQSKNRTDLSAQALGQATPLFPSNALHKAAPGTVLWHLRDGDRQHHLDEGWVFYVQKM